MRFTTEQALRHPWWVSVIRLGFTDSRQACHVFGLEQKNKKQIKVHRFPDPVTSHTVQELVNINDAEQVHALGIKYKQTQMYLIHDWFYYWVCNFQKETFSSAGVKGKIVLVLQRVKRNIWNIGQKYRRVGKKRFSDQFRVPGRKVSVPPPPPSCLSCSVCHFCRIIGKTARSQDIYYSVSVQIQKNFAKSKWKVSCLRLGLLRWLIWCRVKPFWWRTL